MGVVSLLVSSVPESPQIAFSLERNGHRNATAITDQKTAKTEFYVKRKRSFFALIFYNFILEEKTGLLLAQVSCLMP